MLVKNPGNFTISQNELKTYARFVGMCQHLPSLHLDFVGLTMPKNFVIGPLIAEIWLRSCQWNPETPCMKTGSKISMLCPLFFEDMKENVIVAPHLSMP